MKDIQKIKEFFSKPLDEASQTKIPYLPLSKKEVETLNSKGKVTKTFAGTGFSHSVDPKTVNTYLNTKEVTYTDWNTGQRVKAPVDVEYSKQVGYISITVYGKKNMNEAEREVNNIAIGLLEGVNESVIKEFNENFIGAALVKKSGMVKDLDSLEKEPIYVKDVLPIYRKEGSSYVVKSSLTGNALKVPAANLIVKMKDQFEPDKWAKFMAKVSRY